MIIDEEKLLELAQTYETSVLYVKKLYDALKDIPCVLQRDEDTFLICLEMLLQDRISNSFILKRYEKEDRIKKNKSFSYSLSDALYRIYEDEAIPYLTKEYIYVNDIIIHRL